MLYYPDYLYAYEKLIKIEFFSEYAFLFYFFIFFILL